MSTAGHFPSLGTGPDIRLEIEASYASCTVSLLTRFLRDQYDINIQF